MNEYILVVDDNPKNIQLLASILVDNGYKVEFAENGDSALELLQVENFDLILLDVMMPDKDGYEICKEIQLMPDKKEIPIIFVTAKTDVESISKGFFVGAVDYITKPFNKVELLARVENHLHLRRKRIEVKLLAEELQKKNQELETLNLTKDKFISIIAHDLRNPFAALLMSASITEKFFDTLTKDKLRDKVISVMNATEQVINMSNNLLEWATIQAGGSKINIELVSVSQLVKSNIEVTKLHWEGKEITIQNFVPEDIIVSSDKNYLNAIFRNILSNAIKFTPKGGSIKTYYKKENDYHTLSIQDTGVGMSEEQLSKLYQIGVKNKTKGTNNEGGTGLGLILCKEFITKLKGRIEIESTVGVGSTFHIILKDIQGELL